MDEIESQIRRSLSLLVEAASDHAKGYERDIAKMEKELAYQKFKLESKKAAPDRAANFSVQVRGQYQCPRCWIDNEASSPLRPVPIADSKQDFLRCGVCGYEITLY